MEAPLNRPFATFDGVDLYASAIDKAAALLESVVKNHPFVDGNKRTGYVLGRLMLNTFDLDIQATDDEEYDMVISVATGQMDVDGIRTWLDSRVVPFAVR